MAQCQCLHLRCVPRPAPPTASASPNNSPWQKAFFYPYIYILSVNIFYSKFRFFNIFFSPPYLDVCAINQALFIIGKYTLSFFFVYFPFVKKKPTMINEHNRVLRFYNENSHSESEWRFIFRQNKNICFKIWFYFYKHVSMFYINV